MAKIPFSPWAIRFVKSDTSQNKDYSTSIYLLHEHTLYDPLLPTHAYTHMHTVVTLGFAEQEYTFLEGGSEPEVCVVVLEGEIVRSLPIVVAFIEDIPDTAIGERLYTTMYNFAAI